LPRRFPRKVRPKEKDLPKGYDSSWEVKLHTTILIDWGHHHDNIPYIVKKNYEPDFCKEIDGKTILLEAKGRFWDYEEYSKYIWIREALPANMELVFIFYKPQAAMPQAKVRRDGTKRSHAEWAETNNFRWFSEKNIPDEWVTKD
jgi:hypothetical protein